MRTGNPALTTETFRQMDRTGGEPMTLQGTVAKTGIMLGILTLVALWVWTQVFSGAAAVTLFALAGGIGGFVVAMVTIFKKEWSPVTAPLYAALEGMVLGALSAIFEMKFPGIVLQAVLLTFMTLFALLTVYQLGIIKVTDNFRLGLFAATGGIALVYLATFVLGFFGIHIPYIHDSGLVGIGFSVFVVIVAALNLVLDFDFIEHGVQHGAPKYMEWYGAFGLMVTLIWLYIEFLRLLSKLQSRR